MVLFCKFCKFFNLFICSFWKYNRYLIIVEWYETQSSIMTNWIISLIWNTNDLSVYLYYTYIKYVTCWVYKGLMSIFKVLRSLNFFEKWNYTLLVTFQMVNLSYSQSLSYFLFIKAWNCYSKCIYKKSKDFES